LQVSGNLQHQSGRPWARQVRITGTSFPSNPTVYMAPLDGSQRLPSLNLIDARLQKSFDLGAGAGGARFDLFLDALNLTNTDTYENVLSRRGDQPTSYGVGSRFIYPLRLQLGARIKF
jgi:hypothetical protein